jgi:hypothetical protein
MRSTVTTTAPEEGGDCLFMLTLVGHASKLSGDGEKSRNLACEGTQVPAKELGPTSTLG